MEFIFHVISGITKAIPSKWETILRGQAKVDVRLDCFIEIKEKKQHLFKVKGNMVYSSLIFKKLDQSKAHKRFSTQFNTAENEWKAIYLLPHSINISNIARELSY